MRRSPPARSTRLTGKTSSVLSASLVSMVISFRANISPVRKRSCRASPKYTGIDMDAS